LPRNQVSMKKGKKPNTSRNQGGENKNASKTSARNQGGGKTRITASTEGYCNNHRRITAVIKKLLKPDVEKSVP